MYKLSFFLLIFIIMYSSSSAQGCNTCPEHVFDISSYAPGGWSLLTQTKQVSYGGCTFTVKYKTRDCDPYKDMRIDGVTLDPGCTNNLFSAKDVPDCQWLKMVQDMLFSVMSEFVRNNTVLEGTWRIFTPACFALQGQDFKSSIADQVSYGCSEDCCTHTIDVITDTCGIMRWKERTVAKYATCPAPVPVPGLDFDPPYTLVDSYVLNSLKNTFHIISSEATVYRAILKPALKPPCDFVYTTNGTNCIPVCESGRKLTEIGYD